MPHDDDEDHRPDLLGDYPDDVPGLGSEHRPHQLIRVLERGDPSVASAFNELCVTLMRDHPDPRAREIIVLRVAAHCGAQYIWRAHVPIACAVGLRREEIQRIAAGQSAGWRAADGLLLQATDEILQCGAVRPATRKALEDEGRNVVDVVLTAGTYRALAVVLGTFGLSTPEPGLPPVPPSLETP